MQKKINKQKKYYVIGSNGQIMMTIITILLLHIYFTILSVYVINIQEMMKN